MKTRFAPSPNGPLHLGHAYAAMCAYDLAQEMGGIFTLRIEDIDGTRSRNAHVAGIYADMRWLRLDWAGAPVFQSARLQSYAAAAARLRDMGLLYPCTCTRAEWAGDVYPGTCRGRVSDPPPDIAHSWRLDMGAAIARTGPLHWQDLRQGAVAADPAQFGDVVLVRKDAPASYHLAVVLDDAVDGMTHIVRGADLFASTHVHRLLQALLDLPVPHYLHHKLLVGADGLKLSKSKHAPALALLRERGTDGPTLLDDMRAGIFPTGISCDKA